MKKLKLNPVVLDTLTNDQLQRILGGVTAGDTDGTRPPGSTSTSDPCDLCPVTVTAKVTTTTKAPE